MNKKPKVIAIVGPTASGKTSLSIEIAQHCDGEVISADSRQIYKGLDIGSGKVTVEEMADIRHHLLDVVEPEVIYTAADFERDAKTAIVDIVARKKTPIIAGGTLFYIQLLRGVMQSAPVAPNEALRAELELLSDEELVSQLQEKDPVRAESIDTHNRRRLIRSLEIIESLGTVPTVTPIESDYEWLLIGVDVPKSELHKNIHQRLHTRMKQGMLEEVIQLHKNGLSYQRLEDLGLEYRYIAEYLQNKISEEEMLTQIETKSRQFAKRQMTWLKRDDTIEWFNPKDIAQILTRVDTYLAS